MKRIEQPDIRIYRTAYGPAALGLALPVVAIGTYFALVGFGMLPIPGGPEGLHAPRWVVGTIGLTFALFGAILAVNAGRGLWHRHRAAEMRKLYPDRPWLADYPWDPEGIRDHAGRRPAYSLLAVAALGVFLIAFNWWAFFTEDSALLVKGVVAFFDFIWLLALITFGYRLLQWAKYGNSRLTFATFPFAPGERLLVAFSPNRFSRLQATLRYVEERFEASGSGEDRSVHHLSYEHYAVQKTIDVSDRDWRAQIEFELPDNPEWTTRMTADPAIRYWELVLESAAPGLDFRTSFPLPVYAGPGPRTGNPRFATLTETRRRTSGHRFEAALALLVGTLVAVPLLLQPQLPSRLAGSIRSAWQRTVLSRALAPLEKVGGDVMGVAVDPDGAVWVLSKSELSRFSREGTGYRQTRLLDPQRYRSEIGGEFGSLSALLPVGGEQVAAGGWYGQLLLYRQGRWSGLGRGKSPIQGRIFALLMHGDTTYIAATDGLWAWSGDPGSIPVPIAEVPRMESQALARSGDDLLATVGREIWRLRNGRWARHAILPEHLGSVAVLRAAGEGRLWAGTDGGLALLDAGGALSRLELPGTAVTALCESGGRLWAGTWTRGLARREGEDWLFAGTGQGLPDDDLTGIVVDPYDTLWVGMYGKGVARIPEPELLRAISEAGAK